MSREGVELGRLVLVVDDEVDFAVSIADILAGRGYQVATAHSAEEFWRERESFPAQVVLTDVRLGHSDGIDLIAEITRRYPETICVVMTAYATTDSAIQAIQEGAYDYLRKPLQVPDLLATLDRGFEKLALQREQKWLREQLTEARRLEEVAKLTRTVAHETKNPLFAISSGLQLLQSELEETLDKEQRHTFETLFLETMRVSRLVDQLVSYGEIKEYRRASVQLCDVVGEVVSLHRGWCDANQVNIAVGPSGTGVPEVPVDRDKIVQVLVNLVKNALEASAAGDTVEVTCALGESASHVVVEVRDRGPGISSSHQERVFDLFFTTKQDGRGMGLAISQKIVVDHEGEIEIVPRAGGGTLARLTLPIA